MKIIDLLTSTLDVSLPIVSMSFGMYGAMTDTKPKDGKLTPQGRIAITGIVLAGIFTLVIKVGGLYQKIEVQNQEKIQAAHIADSLRQRDSLEQAFKTRLDISLHRSATLIGHLSEQTDISINRMQGLAKEQQKLVTNSIRTIEPLQPLRICIRYTLNSELPEVKAYFDQLIAGKASLMSSPPSGTIVSSQLGHPAEPDRMEIRKIENPYFPKFVQLRNDYALHITGSPINLDQITTLQSFKIRLDPNKLLDHPELQDKINNFNADVDFRKKTVTIIYSTDVFASFADGPKSMFSIYDLAGHYLSVLGSFQKGYTLNDVSFYTGGRYWHLTRFAFASGNYKEHANATQTYRYYTRKITAIEIK
ncbi:hypothetical protein CLV51_104152 [Chitinophaga niastensis]|uniref:Uncharacterized protein n=1 Tax=Chitinophaga niastensis TaxID=536980 RepID=A0A2P8HGY5_CHINA|nr:hypothetical protein [Chitinophaga niastensis]PSL45450.1 hypothetical protein CLV51_104152 [Chitinophaga niastensis]